MSPPVTKDKLAKELSDVVYLSTVGFKDYDNVSKGIYIFAVNFFFSFFMLC